ncbi:P1 family peptidase [Glutamicibacter sp. NPDC087344]|uniref:P1 family peptidase n=1 Tax=Glutamicibacter sp. NPDC087344 TaxID=3363994 RepID=UPI0037FE8A28
MAATGQLPISVPGVGIGHWTTQGSGCTVVLFPPGTVGSAQVLGGAPASRELDALNPLMSVQHLDAALLTGGSAFGLASADGVMRYLREHQRGVMTPAGPVPIVPTLGLFDLADSAARPDAEGGYLAAAAAGEPEAHTRLAVGLVGAGRGARAGRWRGENSYPGGLVYAEQRLGELVVGALCAVNAFGDVLSPGEEPSLDSAAVLAALAAATSGDSTPLPRTNTTIGVVFSNAKLDKTGCHLMAQGAHDGLARAIHPPHTRLDGDAFIAAATGQIPADLDTVRMLTVLATAQALGMAAAGTG